MMQATRRADQSTAPIKRRAKLHVLVVGDQTIIREALRALLISHPDLRIVGTTSDYSLKLPLVTRSRPAVVLIDLPAEDSGIVAISNVRTVFADPDTSILILSNVEERFNVERLIKAGAAGVVFKRSEVSELVEAIKTVAKGEIYVDRAVTGRIVTKKELGLGRKHRTPDLSNRERQVLTLIASGHTHKDIAERLRISAKTVETYRYRIVEKLGIRSRAELVRYALFHGLFHLPSLILYSVAPL